MRFMGQVQPIFQNPFELQPVEAGRPLPDHDRPELHGSQIPAEADDASDRALRKVGLSLAEVKGRYPHELRVASSADRHRPCADPGPSLIVADEPVSMVDASLRVAIVNLFGSAGQLGVSIIYITHDLATAYYDQRPHHHHANGRSGGERQRRAVLDNPQHPYSTCSRVRPMSPETPPS